MKKIISFVLIGIFLSSFAIAQTRTRKIPFLPYSGMPTKTAQQKLAINKKGTGTQQAHENIFFNKGSSSLRADQKKKLIQIGKRLKQIGSPYYSIVAFTAPDVSTSLARARATAVSQALSDFGVGAPVFHYEHRSSSVINPNRVEIHMTASSNSLGSASSNFGRP